MTVFSDEELLRYSRHLLLPEMGMAAQQYWATSKVSVFGCGGLGHPLALYLASSGIGEIHLFDDDQIELSNLQRQIAFNTADIGQIKVEVLQRKLTQLNPEIQVIAHSHAINNDTVEHFKARLSTMNLFFDCTDNFTARYFLNNLSLQLNKPLISAAAIGFSGLCSLFNHAAGAPCYACLFNPDDEAKQTATCVEAGVFAPLLGIVGSHQAALGLNYLAHPHTFSAEVQINAWDLSQQKMRQSLLKKDPDCGVCSVA